MLHPSTKRLIDKLSEMTRKQKVAWQEGENDQVTHDTEGYRVTLTPEPYAVLLTDALGREIETCGPEEYADDLDADGRPYGVFIGELYREARRHARGAEKAISTLLAGLDQVDEAPAPDAAAEAGPEPDTVATDGLVEDPGDDSSPLESGDYPELEGESEITSAVASMAEQVNGQHKVDFIEEGQDEDGAPAETETAVETDHAAREADAALESAEAVAETPEEDIAPPAEDGDSVIAAVAAGDQPDMARPEPGDAGTHSYAPAFAEVAPDATNYTQSVPVGSFAPREPAGSVGPDAAPAPAEPDTPEVQDTLSAADAPEPPKADVEPPQQDQPTPPTRPAPAGFGGAGFFGGSFSSGLARYKTESTPETPAAAPAPDAAPEESESDIPQPPAEPSTTLSGSPGEPAATEARPEPAPAPEPETVTQSDTQPPSQPAFSLSGITSGFGLGSAGRTSATEPAPEPEPLNTDTVVMKPERKVIDGTLDLPDWTPPGDANPDVAAEPAHSPAESEAWVPPADEPASPPPAPEARADADAPLEEPAESESAANPAETETAPQPNKPSRRFNPWS